MTSDAYEAQVRLLVRVLPLLGRQDRLALKGGTAINLFVQDLPRLSVDIDLAYTGLEGRDEALAQIHAALHALRVALEALGLAVQGTPLRGTWTWVKLVVHDGAAQVKVEVSPVLRGTVYAPMPRQTTPAVQARFGFVEVPVLALPDLYAGKLVAALDRQHPRDLYDVRLFLAQNRLDREVVVAFLVYLISHGRPLHEVLRPNLKPLAREFESAFVGMTAQPVTLTDLEQTREALITALHAVLTDEDRRFLLSVARGQPDWTLLPVAGVSELPAVRWKLHNIAQMESRKRAAAVRALEVALQ
ncbi:nucleotidyl transferase AbiEii/AbiGii toxin family protein [Deinococcus sp. UR1]|jgi:predicted nucleotidyltransferase component of viral defense system|uniref:nucleotidyl transferase AbiEii/AbiGii toxin family protein n=1 Tax=Deinococcus sp. UR1 TaxID=1704277 RepID=UPI0006DBDE06|nr:nucleotidyl transferase AbiEii/AbiGii toxin family protein [Deinococcus sp. UR1]PIG97485.1 nucleotidyl transferase AbiEii/AbiGii toxin family protein [Deinococcus sp. UR1]